MDKLELDWLFTEEPQQFMVAQKTEMPKGIILEIGKTYDFVDAGGKHRGICVEVIEKGFIFKEVSEVHFLMLVKIGDDLKEKVVCYQRRAIDYFYEVD